jgi:hypothetical protein
MSNRLTGHAFEYTRTGCQSLNIKARCKCGWSSGINRTVESAREAYRTQHIQLEIYKKAAVAAKAKGGAA